PELMLDTAEGRDRQAPGDRANEGGRLDETCREPDEANARGADEVADDERIDEPSELTEPRREGVRGAICEHFPHERAVPRKPGAEARRNIGRDEQPYLPRDGRGDRTPDSGAEDREDESDSVVHELREHFDDRDGSVVERPLE